MLEKQRVLAVVPARSGSKGIPNKNMQPLQGISLIGWAGKVLAQLPWIDRRIISTDSKAYATEGKRFGLEAPFLRPSALSTDTSSGVDVVEHTLKSMEALDKQTFDIVLVIEPTSPLRTSADIEQTVRRLLSTKADSAVTVSPLPSKFHPLKVLRIDGTQLGFYTEQGRSIVNRQSLSPLYWRNGVCYALRRSCLLEQHTVLGQRCVAVVIDHPVVNVDEPWELEWARHWISSNETIWAVPIQKDE